VVGRGRRHVLHRRRDHDLDCRHRIRARFPGPMEFRRQTIFVRSLRCASQGSGARGLAIVDLMCMSGRRWREQSAMLALVCLALAECSPAARPATPPPAGFASDIAFLRQHTNLVLLEDPSRSAQVAVAPAYQARVMTSTPGGNDAPSFGWIGRAAIASGKRQPHMNVFGGEDRFWLGPE